MSEQEQQYRRRQWETFNTFGTVSMQDVEFPGKRGSFASAIYSEDLDRILPKFLDSCLHRRSVRDWMSRMKKEV